MKRYRIENGVPVAPPRCGISVDGRLISGFATLVESDAAFAAANGYYPIVESEELPPRKGARVRRVDYHFYEGKWIRTVIYEA
ncbi:MAG: hypothetical protein IJC99_03975 [Clostridia bacterium]|nr:hypothetical protein [Clostridia bacterium]